MSDTISNKTVDYRIYSRRTGTPKLICNTKSVELPAIEKMTDTVKGSGIMGELDLPSYGQFSSMELSVNTGVSDETNMTELLLTNDIEIRWVVDAIDVATGTTNVIPHKAFIKVVPKSGEEGTVEAGSSMDGSYKYEVTAYKRVIGGKEVLNIDKLNGIYAINGINMLENVTKNL